MRQTGDSRFLRSFSRFLLSLSQKGFGRHAHPALEVVVEMALAGKADGIGDFGKAQLGFPQQLLGAIDATANMVLVRRNPHRLLKQSGEMVAAQLRDMGEFRQTDIAM
jgi:hypothetical protein